MDVGDWRAKAALMVDAQIRARGIRDSRVLHAMETIPRHEFVPEQERQRAYSDHPITIGLRQTISQPYIVAYMTELLQLESEHRVLEVGTGSGYQTAVLAAIVQSVYTIEIHEALRDTARERLQSLGFQNISYDVRNGHLGWPEYAPFDRIIVTAGATSIPQPLVDQLAGNGRLVIPVGPSTGDQCLKLIRKSLSGYLYVDDTCQVRFVPLLESKIESDEPEAG